MSLCPIIFKDNDNASYGSSPNRPQSIGAGRNIFDSISIAFGKAMVLAKKYCSKLSHRFLTSKLDRIKLAQRSNLTREQIDMILNDPSPLVRLELAWNSSVSQDVLRLMIRDKDSTVSNVARRRLIKGTDEIEVPRPSF